MHWTSRRLMIFRLTWMFHELLVVISCFGQDMDLGRWFFICARLCHKFNSTQSTIAIPCPTFVFATVYRMRICSRHGPNSGHSALLLRTRTRIRFPRSVTRRLRYAHNLQPWISRFTRSYLCTGADHRADDAKRIRCIQEPYDFDDVVRDEVVYHPVREFCAISDATQAVGHIPA